MSRRIRFPNFKITNFKAVHRLGWRGCNRARHSVRLNCYLFPSHHIQMYWRLINANSYVLINMQTGGCLRSLQRVRVCVHRFLRIAEDARFVTLTPTRGYTLTRFSDTSTKACVLSLKHFSFR